MAVVWLILLILALMTVNFYDALSGKKELCTLEELDRDDCLKLFKKYNDIKDKTMY